MQHNVLIVDDRYDAPERAAGYRSFADRFRRHSTLFELNLEFLAKPADLSSKLSSEQYSALLVDVRLDNWEVKLSDVLDVVDDSTPIALLSQFWNDTSSSEVTEAFRRPNCKTFFHWDDIAGVKTESAHGAMLQLIRIIAEHRRLDTTLNLGPNDPISILHISDLQIGGFDAETANLEAVRASEKVHQYCNGKTPTFIAFTGDIVEAGYPHQFSKGLDWLRYFLELLRFPSLPSERIFLVPGNHDFCASLAGSSRLSLTKDKPSKLQLSPSIIDTQRDLATFALRPYNDFAHSVCRLLPNAVYAKEGTLSQCWFEARFRHLGVSFYGLNTCQPILDNCFPDRIVNSDELAFIVNGLGHALADQKKRTVVVGLGHHSPITAIKDQSVNNPEKFTTFFGSERMRTSIFLHGHTHERKIEYVSSDGYRLVRSCAPTLSKGEESRNPDTLRGFSLLTLDRKDGQVTELTGISFDWISGDLHAKTRKRRYSFRDDGMFVELSDP